MSEHPIALYIVLGTKVQLYLQTETNERSTSLGDSLYLRQCSENGFYDYLRNQEMDVVGIRFSPFERPFILEYVRSLDYACVDLARNYGEIYFRGHRELLATGLAEQEFGDDVLWRSAAGIYAIQLGVASLSLSELDSLTKLSMV